jgi:hypothetical protein
MYHSRTFAPFLAFAFFHFAFALPAAGATYSSSPLLGTFNDLGVGYRFRVTAISGANVTFEVLPKTGNFGSPGRAIIKRDSINGTIVGTGLAYDAGASTAGFITVDVSTAGLISDSMDFYAVREGDTNVWDGPITISISGSNDAPTVSVASATMQPNGDLLVNWTANDDLTSSIGTDLYISINDNLNSFSFASKRTPPNSLSGIAQSFTFPAAFLGTLGMNPGGTFRVRVNVFDGSVPQLDGLDYSPAFIYTLPAVVRPDVAVGRSLAGLVGRGVFSQNEQSVTLFSKRARPVVGFATLENRGAMGDSLTVAASRRNASFDVRYTLAGLNITAELTAGTHVTPVIDETDAAVLIRAEVTPKLSKLRKNKRGGGFSYKKRRFTATIRARATSDLTLSDSAAILVRTR